VILDNGSGCFGASVVLIAMDFFLHNASLILSKLVHKVSSRSKINNAARVCLFVLWLSNTVRENRIAMLNKFHLRTKKFRKMGNFAQILTEKYAD
jgi:hypothetical protein